MIIVGLVLAGFSYAIALQVALADLQGHSIPLRAQAGPAARKILPVIGLLLLWVLGVGVGWLFLLVPGLILLTMWSVALPAVVNEPISPFKAFGRSRALTRGNRWRIFLLLFLVLLLFGVVQAVLTQLTAPAIEAGATAATMIPAVLVLALLGIVWGVFTMAVLACLYDQLRRLKEGAGGETMEEVFG
jgi:hypothetical protein